jgi:hypothetical protein
MQNLPAVDPLLLQMNFFTLFHRPKIPLLLVSSLSCPLVQFPRPSIQYFSNQSAASHSPRLCSHCTSLGCMTSDRGILEAGDPDKYLVEIAVVFGILVVLQNSNASSFARQCQLNRENIMQIHYANTSCKYFKLPV